MKAEPLKDKGIKAKLERETSLRGINVEESFNASDVRSACEWFKEHKYDDETTQEKDKTLYQEFIDTQPIGLMYDDWLLEKAFVDAYKKGVSE